MARIKLTQKSIAKLRAPDPSGRQKLYWDSELVGFGVLCSGVTATRTYVVQRDVGGRTRRVTIDRVDVLDLDAARERAKAALAEIYSGNDPKAARRANATLRETLDDYLAASTQLRDKSRKIYRESVEKHLPAWLDRPLREITADMITQRHLDIQTEIDQREARAKEQRIEAARRALKRLHGEALAQARAGLAKIETAPVRYSGKATADSAMRTLRALWNHAAERAVDRQGRPFLPPWPTRRLKKQWHKVPARTRLVRPDDLAKFYAAVVALPNPVARDYLLLLLFTGLRRSEAASLRWDDIDFVERVIHLPAARMKGGSKPLDLPMSDLTRDLLVTRRAVGDETFVFPSDSRAGHITEPKFPLQQVREACGVRVSAHDLRRTFITIAESTDISPLALKALVNHAMPKDITSGYVQMTAERLREPAQRVADKLKEFCGIADTGSGNVAKISN